MASVLPVDDDEVLAAPSLTDNNKSILDDINTAVKEKEVKKLRKLLVDKRQLSGHMLNMADESGTLLHLLSSLDLPLDRYPAVAQSAQEEILALIDSTATRSRGQQADTIGDEMKPDLIKVLWNIIPVPAPVAETVLDHLVEEMLVCRSSHDAGPQSITAVPATMDLPDILGAIYLMRMIKEPDKKRIKYEDCGYLELPGCPQKLQLSACSRVTIGDDNLDQLGRRARRRAALIPEDAAYFAYITGGKGFPTGGFLYLDKWHKPLAVNSISFEPRPYAIAFHRSEKLPADAMEKLQSRARHITIPRLREKGAVKYVWVGEEEREMCGLSGYGFAYFFEDRRMNSFFPIQSIGEVLDRGRIVGHLNAALLNPEGYGIESIVAHADRPDTKPVKFARLKVPDLIHPAILHAILMASRSEVVRTRAAKAITTSAFGQARRWILLGLMLDLVSLACTMWFTVRARAGPASENSINDLCLWSVMLGEWIKTLVFELILACSYWSHGFGRLYFTSQNLLDWSYLLLMLVLLQQLIVQTKLVRILLAVVGGLKWMRMLHGLRGFDKLQIGMRILPILAALGEMASFMLVMLFFVLAWIHVQFALSDASLYNIIFSSYQMAFLGDILLDVGDAEEVEGSSTQDVAFIACSLVVMVAMTNIFIGIMGIAYEEKQKIVEDLFVKARAEISLDFMLVSRFVQRAVCFRRDRHTCIWLCFHTEHHDEQQRRQQQQQQQVHSGHVQGKLEQVIGDLQGMKEELGQQQRHFAGHLQGVQEELGHQQQQLAGNVEGVREELGQLLRVMVSAAAPEADALPQPRWAFPSESEVLNVFLYGHSVSTREWHCEAKGTF